MTHGQEEMLCPLCKTKMQEVEQMAFWRCPECKGEWWPDDGEYRAAQEKVKVKEERRRLLNAVGKTYTVVNPLVADRLKGKGVRGGGSRNGRKKKKKPVMKKLPWMVE